MVQIVIFADVEKLLVALLSNALTAYGNPVSVSAATPAPRPDSFVTVTRVGGVSTSPTLDAPTVSFECWAGSDVAAHDLAQLCRAVINASVNTRIGDSSITRVKEAGGPVNLPDPRSDQSRYVFQTQIFLTGKAVTFDTGENQ